MAAAHPLLSADQYSCSLCKDVLKEPVTIPCGHSYCMRCINDYWDQSDTEGVYSCPQCRKTFNVRPELNRNTVLAEIIENMKEVTADDAPSQSYAGPGDVPCDMCPGRKRRASKTCWTCMMSYCETHLQPHLDFPAFKRHKIDKVTGNLEEKLCGKHQKILEIFCRTDKSCICLLCATTEHKSHNTVTPDVERAGRQKELAKTKSEIKNRIEEKEKTMREMKEMVEKIQSSAENEVQNLEETFRSVLQSIERLRSEVTEVIREYKRRELTKTKEFIERLEKEVKELKMRDTELAELSQTDDHIHFLKKFPSFGFPPGDGAAPEITVNKDVLPEMLRKDLSDLKKSLEEVRGWELVKTIKNGIDDTSYSLQKLRSRNYLLKYACPLTLDPNTAHRRLHLSEDNRKVKFEIKYFPYPDHPERIDHFTQVLCREALSGTRCYWEVEWAGQAFNIGVTYKGIGRKGTTQENVLGCNDKSWCLHYSNCRFYKWHKKKGTIISTPCSHRIGVYLDWPAGLLSFYSVSDTVTLLHTLNTSFTEPLYPGFWVGKDSSVTICPLNLSDQ